MLKLWLRPQLKMEKHCNYTASDNVPNANWNRDNQQADLGGDFPDRRDDRFGARSAVMVL